jgi:hydrogenase nickel incorporation protein HypA/HybF
MHELSLALNILDLVAEESERRGGVRVCAIYLKVGAMSGVVKEALVSAYEIARQGTPMEAAELVIEEAPLIVHCPTCRADRPAVSVQRLACADCGTPTGRIVGGRELEVTALEIP